MDKGEAPAGGQDGGSKVGPVANGAWEHHVARAMGTLRKSRVG